MKNPRIRTLLYGDQHLSRAELDLLHTPALQRLYDLHQLGLTDRIYIDASHSRLHHVVGVLQQTEGLVDAIELNLRSYPNRVLITSGASFSTAELLEHVRKAKPVIRLIGLLHDLTHAPYGHTVEDEIQLVACKHDEPERQSDAFYRLICQYLGWLAVEAGVRPSSTDESVTGAPGPAMPIGLWHYLARPASSPPANIEGIAAMAGGLLRQPNATALAAWRLRSDDIANLLAQLGCAMRALLYLDVLHAEAASKENCPKSEPYAFEQLIEATLEHAGRGGDGSAYQFLPHRDAYMLDIIGNTVCADLLDYAQRDAHFSGIKLGYDAERIAENFTLVSWDPRRTERSSDKGHIPADPFPGRSIRTAISLFSHKLRTDVPSELMNLLNVRFYLYERALFHPTKCAAGAMLGTALQLIGWRPLRDKEEVSAYELPSVFRHVGDAVFLHDLAGAVHIALEAVKSDQGFEVDAERCAKPLAVEGSTQLQVARLILERWNGLERARAEESLNAGAELLTRVMARRFYRPVFRNLPNSRNAVLDMGPEQLAEAFKNPVTRFTAERAIEERAGLRTGRVVIHCPRRMTAQKVANVLLVFPTEDGKRENPRKLREISDLDRDVFEAHQQAILAVERMYMSMWRLVVYVAPESLSAYPEVAAGAGKVIFDTMDKAGSYPEETGWENDKHLERELKQKYGAFVRSLRSDVLQSKEPTAVARSEGARQAVLPVDLRSRFLLVCRGYLKTPRGSVEVFEQWYERNLASRNEETVGRFLQELDESVESTPSGDQRPARNAASGRAESLLAFLGDLLQKHTSDT